MRKAGYTRMIALPRETIWSYLGDLRNDAAWRLEIDKSELIAGQPREAGARYRETLKWEGLTARIELTITEAVPPSRLVIATDDDRMTSRSVWRFESHPDGTIVTLDFSVEGKGPLKATEPFVWKVVSGWLERDLSLLEGHLAALK